MHGLRHHDEARRIRIARVRQQIVVAAQPSQQAIEEGEPLAVAMQDRGLRERQEFGRTLKLPAAAQAEVRRARGLAPSTSSDGFTSLSASARAALRQPSKSVSHSRVMVCIEPSLDSRHARACPGLSRASTPFLSSEAKNVDGRDKPGHDGLL
jgi:hypothetical protein